MFVYSVTMPPRILAGLRRHAVVTRPQECCGALLGRTLRQRVYVSTQIPLENAAAAAASQYCIEAHAVMQLERQAARVGLDVIGFYHSHPDGPALPSPADLELACPGYVYVIIQPPVVGAAESTRAWWLDDDRSGFRELPIEEARPGGGRLPPDLLTGAA
jgi:proteasome lid subunit RPN8/RPN11